jgi:GR25 family glycosyltransferase involved in LPS biosynthesis
MYAGYYINLERSTERRAAMAAQLGRLDPAGRYERFPAVDGNPDGLACSGISDGEFGCLLSHYMLLASQVDRGVDLHVLEDDAVITKRTALFLEQVIGSGLPGEYDILFTDTAVEMDLAWCREARGLYSALIERAEDGTASGVTFRIIPYLGCTTSYLVNHRSVRLVCEILGRELDRGATRPIDILLRAAVAEGKLRASCLFPFITSTRPGGFFSTTRPDNEMRKSRFAMELLRHSFFVECDLGEAMNLAERWLTNPKAGPHERLHARLANFIGADIFHDH